MAVGKSLPLSEPLLLLQPWGVCGGFLSTCRTPQAGCILSDEVGPGTPTWRRLRLKEAEVSKRHSLVQPTAACRASPDPGPPGTAR